METAGIVTEIVFIRANFEVRTAFFEVAASQVVLMATEIVFVTTKAEGKTMIFAVAVPKIVYGTMFVPLAARNACKFALFFRQSAHFR